MSTENLPKRFSACSFSPVTSDIAASSKIISIDHGFQTTSFFLDSSGRSRFLLPLQVGCPSKEDVDALADVDIRFEVKSMTKEDDEKIVTVESLDVVSREVQGNSILITTQVVVRASTKPVAPDSRRAFSKSIINEFSMTKDAEEKNTELTSRCNLLVSALMVSQKKNQPINHRGALPGLLALEMGGGVVPLAANQSPTLQTRLNPFLLTLNLTRALSISVTNVPGSSSGSTLVSLTMTHSNTHSEPVTVTNIALHPGHSRTKFTDRKDTSMPGVATDMTPFVKWGYAPCTEPDLPLTLEPHDAYSTVITIDAGEDLRSREFYSPISVSAKIGQETFVVVHTDTQWTTGRVAVEPADAFRIDMSLKESSCVVGAPFVVSLRVLNLSTSPKDLMLLMAKDEEKSSTNSSSSSSHHHNSKTHGSVNTAVVSEVNGYTFGIWGLSGDDDGTTRHNRDHELLAVDAALLLGEVKGQHSVDAELRFVPLREGTLDVPNLKLYDKTEGKWYNCQHKLQLVAANE